MRLEDLLHEQASQAPLEPAALASVTRRARAIRRRRTAGASLAAVAVVGVVFVGALAASGGGARHSEPPVAHSPSSVATPSVTRTAPAPVTVRTDVAAEQTSGAAIAVPYWTDGQLIAPDGSATPAPARPLALAYDPASRTWAVTVQSGSTQAVVLDRDGHKVGPATPSFPQGVAYDPVAGLVRIVREGGSWRLVTASRTIDLGARLTNASVDGFDHNGDVRLTLDDSTRVAHLADGTVTDGEPPALHASHDGRYVALLGDPQHQVPGSVEWDADGATGTIRILDAATQDTAAAYLAPKDGFFGPWAWEGDDILTLAFERSSASSPTGTWTLVRLGPRAYTVGRSARWPGRIDAPPYVFETLATSAATSAP